MLLILYESAVCLLDITTEDNVEKKTNFPKIPYYKNSQETLSLANKISKQIINRSRIKVVYIKLKILKMC